MTLDPTFATRVDAADHVRGQGGTQLVVYGDFECPYTATAMLGLDLERALDLAEADALMLPFVVVPLRGLLERHRGHRTAHAALLATILDVIADTVPRARAEGSPAPAEPLTESELRVLRYLPSNLSAPEIVAEVFLSTSTVKTHMRHIYEKVGAHKRTEAVERARDLGLLGPSTRPRR